MLTFPFDLRCESGTFQIYTMTHLTKKNIYVVIIQKFKQITGALDLKVIKINKLG